MPLVGGFHTVTSSPVALSSFLPAGAFKQIDFFANEGNAGAVYIGPSTVQSDGTDAIQTLSAGRSWGHGVKGAGEQMQFDFNELYIVGTDNDLFHVSIVK